MDIDYINTIWDYIYNNARYLGVHPYRGNSLYIIKIKRVGVMALFSWRITKYNPQNRDERGNYLCANEWTSFSDVGTKVSEEEYLRIESKYINAITIYMGEMGLNRGYIDALEIWSDGVPNQNASPFLSKMWVGKCVTLKEIQELAKLTLREVIWCKLSFKKKFFVHFGYDYYMYIGADNECLKARQKVEESGLYVEDFLSPYLEQ